jgi:hypothetical protein
MVTTRSSGPRQTDADPDSDVRAAAAQAHRGPHAARPGRLAHSLLFLRIVPVVLLSLLSSMSACVVPAAPNFHDPVGAPNVPPYIVTATPPVGTFIPSTTMIPPQVTVTDQNVGDTLDYQWVIDYPPFDGNTHPADSGQVLPSANGIQQSHSVVLTRAPCGYNPTQSIAVHRLQFILTDGQFDTSNSAVLDALMDSDGFVVRANWTFSCP